MGYNEAIMPMLLHPENFDRVPFRGRAVRHSLERRVDEISRLTAGLEDPDVSVLIRTKNDRRYIETLLDDIAAQDFSGKVEVILVDTESTDGTTAIAEARGARVISITQAEFTYPKALNLGFAVARHPYVVTLVGHSSLVTRYMLRALTYWSHRADFGGMYNAPFINWNATRVERFGQGLLAGNRFVKPAVVKAVTMGVLGANSSIVNRAAWQQYNGYDERYGAGGEEAGLARAILAHDLLIVREPLCTVHHSHGLGLVDNIRQFRHWQEVSRPLAFDERALRRRRPDLD